MDRTNTSMGCDGIEGVDPVQTGPASTVVPTEEAGLLRALDDPSEEVREAAVEGLSAWPEHRARLEGLYGREASACVRMQVVRALASNDAFLLRVLTTDRDAEVRRFAAECTRLGRTSRWTRWVAGLRDGERDPSVRRALDESAAVLAGAR